MFVLLFRIESDVKARYAMLGIEFGENRNLLENTRLIPADTKEIYLQFHLESRANSTIPLEFRWYAGDQLAYTSSGAYEDGYVITSFEPDSNKPGGFPAGNYHVEVWFKNTMILTKSFVVE
jgi:hypothetical protein